MSWVLYYVVLKYFCVIFLSSFSENVNFTWICFTWEILHNYIYILYRIYLIPLE